MIWSGCPYDTFLTCCVPFGWVREAFCSNVAHISKQIIIVTLFSTVSCFMPEKNYPTMTMTQAKTPLLHTQAFTFAVFYISWQFILMKFENLCHFNHTLLKLYLLSQHVTCTHTHIASWPPKAHSKQWAWGMIFLPKHTHLTPLTSPSNNQIWCSTKQGL